ncbi:MAG: hypothetical protein HC890_15405 [Chloroflexaceae bacterium]|nr:hypothetical protein [Chloroflexaceae bacterium]
MRSIPYELVATLATQFNAVECYWRESERSFSGFVAEVWFATLPKEFAQQWAATVGYSILVRSVNQGPSRFTVSIPVSVPCGEIQLGLPSRGSRLRLVPDESLAA